MGTTTVTSLPTAPRLAPERSLDAVEMDVENASRILRSAATLLTETYGDPNGEPLDLEEAKRRYALANRVQDNLKAGQDLVSGTLKETATIILAAHKHGDNIDIDGEIFHRYDEVKANSVSWKDIAAKAKEYLTGHERAAITRMENAQKSIVKTYFRLKPGTFKGNK